MGYVFIPRMLWSGKPLIQQGQEYAGVVHGPQYMALSDTSIAAGFYASLYLGYGWIAFGMGASLVGLLIAALTRFAHRFGGSFGAGLFLFAMLPYALRLSEAWSVGAMTWPIVSLIYVLAILALARLVGVVMIRKRQSVSGV